jgi:hypothetical protein
MHEVADVKQVLLAAATGSDGIRCEMANVITDTPASTSRMPTKRRVMKIREFISSRYSGLAI